MNKLTTFDVLIVYAQGLARSAYHTSKHLAPFAVGSRNESYNIVYGYFLKTCQDFGLKAGFTTSADIIGPGFCRSFWQYTDGVWIKSNTPCFSKLIFDKFSPINSDIALRRQLLFSSPDIKPFNHPGLYDLFFDKQKTYNRLSSYAIPTVCLDSSTLSGIKNACQTLAEMVGRHSSTDFSLDLIMKDRFGAGGRHIHKFKSNSYQEILATAQKHQAVSYILQPFTNFNAVDIRLVYLRGKIIQSYIRVAKPGEFRCNEHCGGLLTYQTLDKIPATVLAKADQIARSLNNTCSLFTLDFIVGDSGDVYLLEGNTGPGLDWNMSIEKNEIEAKKLINLVVKELTVRAKV